MIVKLLNEHHLEFLSLKGGCRGSSESNTCQNVKLLEITPGLISTFCLLFLVIEYGQEVPRFMVTDAQQK